MITISNLRVAREGKTICAVEQLSVAAGDRIAVLGANGSGKTTLLRVMAGLTSDFTGTCLVEAEQRQVTYLHQQPCLFRGSVLSNVRYGERNGAGQGTGASDWLDRLQVAHLAGRSVSTLSGGEVRRVALARAIATRPRLLLLDEPFADLDEQATETVCTVLQQLANSTIVIASPNDLPDGLVDSSFRLS